MARFLDHIRVCTSYDSKKFKPFCIGGEILGWVTREARDLVAQNVDDFVKEDKKLVLNPGLQDFNSHSAALAKAAKLLAKHYDVKLRRELYPVVKNWGDDPLAALDRAAVPWFGVRGFGVHVNGFVRKKDGIHIWIAERAMDRRVAPGKLDNMIGGGMPLGLTLEENLVKEAYEEAGMAQDLASKARFITKLRYKTEGLNGLRNDTLFIFDLELPPLFTPHNQDGEVAAFYLMPLAEVMSIIEKTDRFKLNCSLVMMDFFLRHGALKTGHPEYEPLRLAFADLLS